MININSPKRTLILAATLLAVLAFAACSDNLTGFNKYFSGRTLTINVVEIDRPSAPGLELVLVRMKVENHT